MSADDLAAYIIQYLKDAPRSEVEEISADQGLFGQLARAEQDNRVGEIST
jgi:hypothetical protein